MFLQTVVIKSVAAADKSMQKIGKGYLNRQLKAAREAV